MAAVSNLIEESLSGFKVHDEGFMSGYIEKKDLYESFLCHLRARGYSFSTRSSRNSANGKDSTLLWKHLRKGTPTIDGFGFPFCVEGSSIFQCSQGPKYYKNRKQELAAELSDHAYPRKKRIRLISTKKLGCPAYLKVRQIKYFPEFGIKESTSLREKAKVLQKLKDALKSHIPSVQSVQRFYIEISNEDVHSHSRDSCHLTQETHPDVISEIYRLVDVGTSSVKGCKLLLDQYVEKKFENGPKPNMINSAFYPSETKIYAHMHNAALKKVKKSLIGQETLSAQVEEQKSNCPSDNIDNTGHIDIATCDQEDNTGHIDIAICDQDDNTGHFDIAICDQDVKTGHFDISLCEEDDYTGHIVIAMCDNDNSVQIPVTIQNENSVKIPVTIQNGNLVEIPVTIQNDNLVEVPVTIKNDNSVEIPVTIQNGNLVEVPVTIKNDNSVEIPVTIQNGNLVEVPVTIQNDNSVEIPVTIQNDNSVVHVTIKNDSLVDIPVTIQNDNSVPLQQLRDVLKECFKQSYVCSNPQAVENALAAAKECMASLSNLDSARSPPRSRRKQLSRPNAKKQS